MSENTAILHRMETEKSFQVSLQKKDGRWFLPIPFDSDGAWGAKARHCVTGTIEGKTVRGSLKCVEAAMQLPLGPAWLRDSGIDPGQPVNVVLMPEGPQSAALAYDLVEAFRAEPKAAAFFDAMPTFYRKNYMRWIDGAKRPETRQARIRETIEDMKIGKRAR
jgi:hypothetical protein